jgi:hypothetical protein
MSSSVGLGITNPIKAGSIRAFANLSALDTDWHDLSSDDFYDTTTGSACASGLKFAWVGVVNLSLENVAYIKYRPRTLATDTTDNEMPVLPYATHADDVGTLSALVTTISVAKGGAGDTVYVIAGFERA